MIGQKNYHAVPEACIKVHGKIVHGKIIHDKIIHGQKISSVLQQKEAQVFSKEMAIYQVRCPVSGCIHCIHASELAQTLIELDYHYYTYHRKLL